MQSPNAEIARMFARIADSLEILDESGFKVNAYRKASRSVSSLARSLGEFGGEKELRDLPGIGKDLSKKIVEYSETGKIEYYEEIRKRVPDSLAELLEIRGVGPKFLKTVARRFGVSDLESLKKALADPALLEIRGVGEKKLGEIRRGMDVFEKGKRRMRLSDAHRLAAFAAEETRKISGVVGARIAGSVRRMRETAAGADIVAAADNPEAAAEEFSKLPFVGEVLEKGAGLARVAAETGAEVKLLAVRPEHYGSALLRFTGSASHNGRIREIAAEAGLGTGPLGLRDGAGEYFPSEELAYESLGLPFIAPEIREDRGEVEAALAGDLPPLLETGDIRGDLHTHSTWSDGACEVREMVEKAASLGYEYMAVTDHSPSSRIANGLDERRLRRKMREIETINGETDGITVLMGSEVDIRPDGSLDYPDEVLAELDFVVASVHSAFSMEEDEMTARICSALENPHVHALGHPTGRLIGQREPYRVDMDAVIRTARDRGKALEVNSSYKRLDLKDAHVRKAIGEGVRLIVSTDAHRTEHMDRMIFGVGTARRGWARREDVINALGISELLEWLASRDR